MTQHLPQEGFPGLEEPPYTNNPLDESAFIGFVPKDYPIAAINLYIGKWIATHGEDDSFIADLVTKRDFLVRALDLVTSPEDINNELVARSRSDRAINYPVEMPALKSPEVFDTQLVEGPNKLGLANNFAAKFALLKPKENALRPRLRAFTREEIFEALNGNLTKSDTKTHLIKESVQRAGTLFPEELVDFMEKVSKRAVECMYSDEHRKHDYVQEYAEEFFIWHEILRHLVDAADPGVMKVNTTYFIG